MKYLPYLIVVIALNPQVVVDSALQSYWRYKCYISGWLGWE